MAGHSDEVRTIDPYYLDVLGVIQTQYGQKQ